MTKVQANDRLVMCLWSTKIDWSHWACRTVVEVRLAKDLAPFALFSLKENPWNIKLLSADLERELTSLNQDKKSLPGTV